MRGLISVAVALALIAGTVLPARAADPSVTTTAGQARAMELLNTPCLPIPLTLAQASPASPAASSSPADEEEEGAPPSPEPSPSITPGAPLPRPVIPIGPGILVPPPLPSKPPVTPPPLPSPSPTAVGLERPDLPHAREPPTATPTPAPPPTAGPIRSGPRASPTPTAAPSPGETLGPNDYAILGDELTGNRTPGEPFDLDGHVNIIYQDGILVGDHAHYDGTRYIDVTGNTYIQNHARDSTLTADSIRFDTITQNAQLINGRGVTTEGVDRGRLHFNAQEMVTQPNGVTHGTRASLTTCENPHGGYHLEAKTIDITPGDKAVARSVTVFLGPLAIFFLPLMIIPLKHESIPGRTQDGLRSADRIFRSGRLLRQGPSRLRDEQPILRLLPSRVLFQDRLRLGLRRVVPA